MLAICWDTFPWSQLTPFTSWHVLHAKVDIQKRSEWSSGFWRPPPINSSHEMPKTTHNRSYTCWTIPRRNNWRPAGTNAPYKERHEPIQYLIERKSLNPISVGCCTKSGMAFVAVVYILMNTQFLQRKYATDTYYLLFQTVLPIAAVEGMGYRPVGISRIYIVIGIQKIQFNTSYIHSPYGSIYLIIQIKDYFYNHRVAIGISWRSISRLPKFCAS